MDRRKQRFQKRTAVTKEQALNFLCANEAAEQNREAHRCGERNSNGITQPSGAATPQNSDAHDARRCSEGSLLLSLRTTPGPMQKTAKYALLFLGRPAFQQYATHAEGSDSPHHLNTPLFAPVSRCVRSYR